MILYFTGTGNSRFAAELLSEKTGDELVSLNNILKSGSEWEFHSDRPFVFVAPVYAWRLPEKIEEILKKGRFCGSRKVYVAATMGSHAGLTAKYCRDIITARGMDFMGFSGICMPDNYLVSYRMMESEEAVRKIRACLPELARIAEIVRLEQPLEDTETRKAYDRFLSGTVNWSFYHFMVHNSRFTVSSDCIRCGQCVRVCPVNNIALNENRISFGQDCMFCLSCIHMCPVHAIDYKGKAKKNGYYSCPPAADILKTD